MPLAGPVTQPCSALSPRAQAGSLPALSSAQLRKLINRVLVTDADLDAFCLDYFRDVYFRFSDGMDRQRKLNLLLSHASSARIRECLQTGHADALPRELSDTDWDEAAPPLHNQRAPWRAALVGIGLALIMGTGLTAQTIWRAHSPIKPEQNAGQMNAPASRDEARSPKGAQALLTSEPTGALVIELPSGRVLGQTPWAPYPTQSPEQFDKTSARLCLRMAGFVSVPVKLEAIAGPSGIRPLHMQLQRDLRAGTQYDLGQEACNVPTPHIP